jgi:branched-chain amino acid transport system ATP-binding protein
MSAQADPLLQVEGLGAGYGDLQVVFDADLTVSAGEMVGIVGPNGAGKSTLLGAIVGAVRGARGRVRLSGDDILGRKPEDVVRRGLALVPEGRHIFTDLTVAENLQLGLTARRDRSGKDAVLKTVAELFPVLTTHAHQRAGVLSGGQQQQLAIARALVAEPDLVMMDEPSLGLAPTVIRDVFDVMADIRTRGTAILVVEQRAHLVIGTATRTHVLREGRIRDTLTPADGRDETRLAHAYFGAEVAAT